MYLLKGFSRSLPEGSSGSPLSSVSYKLRSWVSFMRSHPRTDTRSKVQVRTNSSSRLHPAIHVDAPLQLPNTSRTARNTDFSLIDCTWLLLLFHLPVRCGSCFLRKLFSLMCPWQSFYLWRLKSPIVLVSATKKKLKKIAKSKFIYIYINLNL